MSWCLPTWTSLCIHDRTGAALTTETFGRTRDMSSPQIRSTCVLYSCIVTCFCRSPIGTDPNIFWFDRLYPSEHLSSRHPASVREHMPSNLLDRGREGIELHQHVRLQLIDAQRAGGERTTSPRRLTPRRDLCKIYANLPHVPRPTGDQGRR